MPSPGACRTRTTVCAAALIAAVAAGLPEEAPALTLGGGRVRAAFAVTGTYSLDDEGYFNYGDYQTSRLRLLRLDLTLEARLAAPAALLAEVRSDNLSRPRVYALYLRLHPWRERSLDVQAGLVPPVFGAAPRRYVQDEPLPSLPLVYQYLTDLRADAVPLRSSDLVENRGRGWLVRYPSGSSSAAPGLPLIAAERWDVGVQVRGGAGPVSASLAVTQGSPSRPRVRDDNGGKQLSGRVEWQPGPALTVGVSAAQAAFLSDAALASVPASSVRNRQRAFGVDAAWAAGYWLVRGELVLSRWQIPALAETRLARPLAAGGGYVEARYKLRPGLYVAGRLERLAFGSVDSEPGSTTWDAPVSRVEAAVGYVPQRHVTLRASWQHNRRDGGRVRRSDLLAASLLLWF